MKLIVGLGNPGLKYKYTLHNIGFRVIDYFAKEHKFHFKTDPKFKAKVAYGRVEDEDVALFKSQRFMNLCGLSLAPFVLANKIEIKDILVICDCLDLPFGKIRFKTKGSDAGHRGMRSIISALGKNDFSRTKIGIGRPNDSNIDISEYVLSRFSAKEEKELSRIIEEAKSKISQWVKSKETTYEQL